MKIHLLAVGNKMPAWVESGFQEYARRLPPECSLKLIEIPLSPRGKNVDLKRALAREGERMLKAIPKKARVIALDVRGKSYTSEALAGQLGSWMESGLDIALLVGGPDGLAPACLQAAHQRWSLSPLTLPHPLVRVILAEQIYRAWSQTRNHPYHRA